MRSPDDITVRHIPFEFSDDIKPRWNPSKPEWSHMANGASLTMPYLEPFLIKSIQEALPKISDPAVRAEAMAFCAQEAQHYKTHRRYNDLLKKNGYPELALLEEEMERQFNHMNKNWSLQKKLAYTAGFETMTLAVTRWLIGQRRSLFGGSDSRVASFILWHMVEETEHKNVAYRVYQATTPNWFRRAFGVLHGGLHVALLSRRGYMIMLKKDKRWSRPLSRLRVWWLVLRFLSHSVPTSLRGLLPWHNPSREKDSKWVKNWIEGYQKGLKEGQKNSIDFIPLIDTSHPEIPTPFETYKGQAA